jgi:Kef-type K+ transport system membrane component KefB
MPVNVLNAGQVVAFVLVDIVIILLVARSVGRLFVRLGQPRVVGEIVAGVLLGPTLLGATLWPGFEAPAFMACDQAMAAVPPGPGGVAPPQTPTACLFPQQSRNILGPIGQIALLLFMFLTGLEVKLDRLKGRIKGIVLVGLGVVVVPLVLGFLVAPALSTPTFKPDAASSLGFTLFVGAMLAVTAFPVMARILQEKGLTLSPMGSTGIAAAAVTTIAMFLAASAASSLATGGSTGALVLTLVLSLAYLAAMFVLVKPLMARLGAGYAVSGRLDPGFFAAILIMLFASGAVAHVLGLNVIVGGFVAGLVLPSRDELFADMSARLSELTATVLLPIFLAFSGLGTDFTKLSVGALGGIALFLVAGIVAKWAGGAAFARLGGFSWAEGNVLGILMNCRGLLVLVVALVGVQAGVITPVMQLGAVLMALITTAMTGPLFDLFSRRLPEPPPASPPAAETIRETVPSDYAPGPIQPQSSSTRGS